MRNLATLVLLSPFIMAGLALIGWLYDIFYFVHHMHDVVTPVIVVSMVGLFPAIGCFTGWLLMFFG